MSFESIVLTWPGQQAGAVLPVTAARLAGLEHWLRESVVDALPAGERGGDARVQNAARRAGHGALLRAFVGVEDGSFVQYPAREVSTDPRSRPWYVMASRDPALHWTLPVVDLEETVLPHVTSSDAELDLPAVDDPTLARRIAGNERGGYVESGKRLFVFSKLLSPPWTYVAELERGKYVER